MLVTIATQRVVIYVTRKYVFLSRGKAAIERHLESSKHLAKAKVVLDRECL